MTHKIELAADFLRALGEDFLVLLLSQAGPHTKVAYASTLERSNAMRLLVDYSVTTRNQLEPRVMGQKLETVSDAYKIACFEMLEALQKATEGKIPPDVWRDLLLAFCTGMAHDQGVTRADFERCMIELAQEEWSTADTAGRAAVTELLGKVKPG